MNSFNRLLHKIKINNFKIGVLGLGYVGLPLAVLFANKGIKVIGFENSQKKIYPASLTKMMTLYILFEEISKKRISFNSKFVASRSAELSRPSKLFLKNKDEISVISCIRALIIKSANDVAVTVAENIAGSEARFAYIMNKKAYELVNLKMPIKQN